MRSLAEILAPDNHWQGVQLEEMWQIDEYDNQQQKRFEGMQRHAELLGSLSRPYTSLISALGLKGWVSQRKK